MDSLSGQLYFLIAQHVFLRKNRTEILCGFCDQAVFGSFSSQKELPKIVRSQTVSFKKYDIFEFDSKGPEGRREQQMRTELKAVCIYGKTKIDHLFP